MNKLPNLPRADCRGPDGTGTYFDSYTADQMRDYARAALAAQPGAVGLTSQQRVMLAQAWTMLEDYAVMNRRVGNDSFADGAIASAHEIKLMLAAAPTEATQPPSQPSAARALAGGAEQAVPTDAKDAARYRYLVVMETKAAPDTVAHYIRNPAHLDRVIEVMEQKP